MLHSCFTLLEMIGANEFKRPYAKRKKGPRTRYFEKRSKVTDYKGQNDDYRTLMRWWLPAIRIVPGILTRHLEM